MQKLLFTILKLFNFVWFQSAKKLLKSSVTNFRNIIILLGHWLLHAYGISSITPLDKVASYWAFFVLVPLPAVFYILTAKFTDPKKVHCD
jgi:JNK1/MAPK8-associated membrane protein